MYARKINESHSESLSNVFTIFRKGNSVMFASSIILFQAVDNKSKGHNIVTNINEMLPNSNWMRTVSAFEQDAPSSLTDCCRC